MAMVKRPQGRTASILDSVGSELKEDPPAAVERAKRREGKAKGERVRRAILLSKARKSGADIPPNPNK